MMKKTITFWFVLIIFSYSYAQEPVIQWSKQIFNIGVPSAAIKTSDGGYVAVGNNEGRDDYVSPDVSYVYKMNSLGVLEWRKTVQNILLRDIAQMVDGKYIAVGTNYFTTDAILLTLDQSANIISQTTKTGDNALFFNHIIKLKDGSFVVMGTCGSTTGDIPTRVNCSFNLTYVPWFLKLSSTGSIISNKLIKDNCNLDLFIDQITETSDGGFMAVGTRSGSGVANGFIFKFDSQGNVQGEQYLGENTEMSSVCQTSNGEYVCLGVKYANDNSDDATPFVILLNTSGSIITNEFGKYTGFSSRALSVYETVQATTDGGVIICSSSSDTADSVGYGAVAKYDKEGQLQWKKELGSGDGLVGVFPTSDNGYMGFGVTTMNKWGIRVGESINPYVVKLGNPLYFCNGATVSDLTPNGSNIQWNKEQKVVNSSDILNKGIYYYFQNGENFNNCGSITYFNIDGNTPQPTTLPKQYLSSVSTVGNLIAKGIEIKWYSTLTGGAVLASTTKLLTATYYVSQTINGCESSPRLPVSVTIDDNDNMVLIGSQNWMQKNLDVDRYRNGDPIPQVQDYTQWSQLTTGAWCYYNNDPSNNELYGKLYNYFAVMDPRGLAPAGYHIPNYDEWITLRDYLGGESVAGNAMKIPFLWTGDSAGNNSSGFTALPAGYRNSQSLNFQNILFSTGWWSANSDFNSCFLINWYGAQLSNVGVNSQEGFSVRCIKDSSLNNQSFENTNIIIFPNPVKNQLNIQSKQSTVFSKIIITDITGKTVLIKAKNTNFINVESLAKGIYVLEAFSDKEKYIRKFIKD